MTYGRRYPLSLGCARSDKVEGTVARQEGRAAEAFRGGRAEALEFFDGLEAANSKAYWQRNKGVYEELVRAPMEALLAELEPEWGEGRIFRPYRDVRFSRDKSPYKTHIGAVIGEGYVQLSAEGLGAGCGMWEMAPDQLERYRAAVADDRSGDDLTDLVAEARAAGLQVMAHGALKTAPRGYPKDHARIELLRYKGVVAWRDWPPGAWLGTHKAKDRVVGFLRRAQPIDAWLRTNVGPSTLPERRR
ncbi:MAG: DUF2461 domain-containing protein [Actinomycetota bacterium]